MTVAGFSLREVIKFIQGCTNQLSKKGESKEEKRAHVKETMDNGPSKIYGRQSLKNLKGYGLLIKNGLSKICGRQSLKNSKGYGLFKQSISLQIF